VQSGSETYAGNCTRNPRTPGQRRIAYEDREAFQNRQEYGMRYKIRAALRMGRRMSRDAPGLIESPLENIRFPEIDISEIAKEFGEISLSDIFENIEIEGETLCEKETKKKRKPQAKKPSLKK
jgi:hypothetical protein